MRKIVFLGFSLSALLTIGCNSCKKNQNAQTLSQRFIHKYGYDVSKEEWESQNYPGQIITTYRNGVTVTASYEDGMLHGSLTKTYPHSVTPNIKQFFERGHLIKEIAYDLKGLPIHQKDILSPTSIQITKWYHKGSPLSVEKYSGEDLFEGSYYTPQNELECFVENGFGTRTNRNSLGELLCKDLIEDGHVAKRETFYSNGIPKTQINYLNGILHGEKREFGMSGDPLYIEPYENGKLNGIATYFQNGHKYHEIPYINGQREGIERYYTDGETVIEEAEWRHDVKHGLSIVYLDGYTKKEWYYEGNRISKEKFKQYREQEKLITQMHERSHKNDKND